MFSDFNLSIKFQAILNEVPPLKTIWFSPLAQICSLAFVREGICVHNFKVHTLFVFLLIFLSTETVLLNSAQEGILRPKLRGWLNYYGKFRISEMRKLFKPLHLRLTKWIRKKYRRYRKKNWYCDFKYLQQISKSYPYLFEHWKYEGLRP